VNGQGHLHKGEAVPSPERSTLQDQILVAQNLERDIRALVHVGRMSRDDFKVPGYRRELKSVYAPLVRADLALTLALMTAKIDFQQRTTGTSPTWTVPGRLLPKKVRLNDISHQLSEMSRTANLLPLPGYDEASLQDVNARLDETITVLHALADAVRSA
jgi:hypothetical protein